MQFTFQSSLNRMQKLKHISLSTVALHLLEILSQTISRDVLHCCINAQALPRNKCSADTPLTELKEFRTVQSSCYNLPMSSGLFSTFNHGATLADVSSELKQLMGCQTNLPAPTIQLKLNADLFSFSFSLSWVMQYNI